jgi:hypothetical protein
LSVETPATGFYHPPAITPCRHRRGTDPMANLLDSTMSGLDLSEQAAFSLSQAALLLDQARNDKGLLATALETNMEVWIAIRTLVAKGSDISRETRDNLVRLSKFVSDTTLKHGVDLPTDTLNTLINVNLQISEGFLEGRRR